MAKVKDRPEEKRRERIFLKSGVEFTPQLEEELSAEAERGYDLSKARRRFLGHPLTFARSQVELDAVRRRAEKEGRPFSEVTREELKRLDDEER